MAKLQATELKMHVADLDAIKARIEAAGGTVSAPRVFEKNIRFEDAHGELAKASSVLRLRYDTRARLTYKDGQKVHDQYGSTRFEAEVEVSDLDTMQIILERLGFYPMFIYEKYRTTYELAGAEIMLDELPYGNFVEIEGDETTIRAVLDAVDFGKSKRYTNSYSVLFLVGQRNRGWSFRDLTFDNFKGIALDEAMFAGAV